MKKKPAKPSRLTATPFPRKPTPIDRFADATRRDGLHALRQRCDALSARLGHVEARLTQIQARIDGHPNAGGIIAYAPWGEPTHADVGWVAGGLHDRILALETRPSLWRRLARMWP